jgi:hypothetical protein
MKKKPSHLATPASLKLEADLRKNLRRYLTRHHPELGRARRRLLSRICWRPSAEEGSAAVQISFRNLSALPAAARLPDIVREFLNEQSSLWGCLDVVESDGCFEISETTPDDQTRLF